jgi:uncharacterized protein (DUF305 family)
MSTRNTSTRKTLLIAGIAAVLAGGAVGGVALAQDLDGRPGGAAYDRSSAAMAGMPGMGMPGAGLPGMGMSGMAVEDEFGYLTMMIPHHEEAIRNGRILLEGTDRPEMRVFATSIIETQTREVEQMRNWLAIWYPGRDTAVDYAPMMRDLPGLRGDALDRAFLADMIPHHMGAVMMSQQLLGQSLAAHTELEPFARTVRDAQHAEIVQMRGWLADWFGATGMGPGGGMGSGGMGPGGMGHR